MNRDRLEQAILSLWVTTRVPLTRVNLQVHLGVPRKKLERQLDELVKEGVLEVDSDEHGEMLWIVPGAERPREGLTRVADLQKLDHLRRSAGRDLARRSTGGALTAPGQKSLVASGLLSFFLGPLGWLYAAPVREVVPAAAIYLLAIALVPSLILRPLLALFLPLSALFGVLYAWQHNLRGQRTSVLELGSGRPPR